MATNRKKKPAKRASGGNLGIPVLLRAVDETELRRWTEAAERAGITRTAWLRDAANRAAAHG